MPTIPLALLALAIAALSACATGTPNNASKPSDIKGSTTATTVSLLTGTSSTTMTISPPTTTVTCTSAPSRFGEPGPHSRETIDNVMFLFEDGVIEQDRSSIRDGVRFAKAFINDGLGGVRGSACIDLRIDPDRSGSAEGAGGNRIVLRTTASGWKPPNGTYPEWHLVKVSAHEYSHVWQSQVGGTGTFGGPNWLFEGAAEHIGYQSAVAGGVLSETQARAFNISNVNFASPPPLQSFERGPRDGAPQVNYGLAALAVKYLTENRGAGSLLAYWQALSNGSAWATAFQASFGETADDFYGRFEAYRDRGFAS